MPRTKTFDLNRLEIPNLEGIPERLRKKTIYQGVKVVAKKARTLAPRSGAKRKGRLHKSITYTVRKHGTEGVVKAKAPHAHLVHDGTKPHVIRARPGKVLVFRAGSRMVVRRAVQHPGAKAQPFLTDALDQTWPEMVKAMHEALKQGMERL
jgi:HK97 gp10 family phage protein